MTQFVKLILLLLCLTNTGYSGDINFTHLTTKDGLLNSTVYFAMQDSKGFIWFCTETGVNRYDGKKFEKFTIDDGLGDNENFKCYEDRKGRIWFFSFNGKFSYYYKGNVYNSENTRWLMSPSSGSFLLNCVEDKKGNIWFSNSNSDVIKVSDTTISFFESPQRTSQHNNYYITSKLFLENDSAKKFLLDTLFPEKIYKYNIVNRDLLFIGNRSSLFANNRKYNFNDLDYSKGILFLAENTLIQYQNNNDFRILNTNNSGVKSRILSFFSEGDNLWLGTSSQGAYKISKNTNDRLEKASVMLPGQIITCIFKDSESNIWFTTHGNGVFVIKHNASFVKRLSTAVTYSIGILKRKNENYIFTGGDQGNVTLWKNNSLIRSFQVSNHSFNRIRNIIPISDKQVIFCSDNTMLSKYDYITNIQTQLTKIPGYKNSCLDYHSVLWACTQDNIFKLVDNNCVSILHTTALGKISSIAVITDSVYYVGTSTTLYKVINTKPIIILDDILLKTSVSDLKIINGILWVATHGNGIFLLRNDTVYKHLTVQQGGITSNICQSIYDDKSEYIWLATNHGISVIKRESGDIVSNINSDNGLTSDDVKNIAKDSEYVYLATADGTNIFRLSEIIARASSPKVYVTSFSIGNKKILDPGDSVKFNFFNGFINIYFTVATFQSPEAVQYRYKFENDAEWHNTQTSDISLFKLTPGIHKLLLSAKKYNSNWSNPTTLVIKVNPLWYQSVLFYMLIVLLLASLIYYMIQKRIKIIHSRSLQQTKLYQKITELESKSLAHQMNPHFIFNSLNTVQQFMLVKEEEQGLNYLTDFSVLIRNILENSRKTTMLLSEEIEFLERYLSLEKVRFNNKFEYNIITEEKLYSDEIKIPPMLLQPLLENAIKHGISPMNTKGVITIRFKKEKGFLNVTIEDNGVGIYSNKKTTVVEFGKKESTALKVVEERLKLTKNKKGEPGTITISDKSYFDKSMSGTIIEITIPINLQ